VCYAIGGLQTFVINPVVAVFLPDHAWHCGIAAPFPEIPHYKTTTAAATAATWHNHEFVFIIVMTT